jgi:hypothetical protein
VFGQLRFCAEGVVSLEEPELDAATAGDIEAAAFGPAVTDSFEFAECPHATAESQETAAMRQKVRASGVLMGSFSTCGLTSRIPCR